MLTGVTPVVLGMLRSKPRSGYDIKTFVDRSTRFFWAASYGQIYPELRRLTKAGLIETVSRARGGRRRAEYRLTSKGEETLREWLLADEPALHELRDEGMLKLFFADAVGPDDQLALVRKARLRHETTLERLKTVNPPPRPGRPRFPLLTRDAGVAMHDAMAKWYAGVEQMLVAEIEGGDDVRVAS